MKVLGLNCDKCGAPIEVGARANFVTCAYCDARLKIVRGDSAAYTEVLDALEKRTTQIEQDMAVLKLQGERDRLDRRWESARDRYSVRGKDGQYSVPSVAGTIAFGVVWVGVTGFMFVMFLKFAGWMALGPLAVGTIGLVGLGLNVNKARAFERDRERYRRERRGIDREIRGLERSAG